MKRIRLRAANKAARNKRHMNIVIENISRGIT